MIEQINALARNQKFLKLHRELNKFNIFHATGMKNQEIKHTQFLGYLLDPNESHGFRDEFLIRFIQSLPRPENNGGSEIKIMDFNLNYAKVIKEKRLPNAGILDFLIEIPSFSFPEKIYIISIENKIRANEGRNQLTRYRNAITAEYNDKVAEDPIFLYLNINNEEPSDECWMPILYSDTVIKAIKSLMEDLEDTLSDYMTFILKNYIELINKEGEHESENILEEIMQEMGVATINSAQEILTAEPELIEYERLKIKYQKALEYIKNYDADFRKNLLSHFTSQFGANREIQGEGYRFKLETSNKNWMRFSFLSDENRKFLSNKICKNPSRRWLESQCNLAFEFIFSKPGENNRIDCRVSLMLGPTGIEYQNRSELLRLLKSAFNETHKIQANPNVEARDHFDAIRRGAYRRLTKINISEEDAKQWITKTLAEISRTEQNFIQMVNENLKTEVNRNRLLGLAP
jgi:PD-(D/E)XK nuclease superfamily